MTKKINITVAVRTRKTAMSVEVLLLRNGFSKHDQQCHNCSIAHFVVIFNVVRCHGKPKVATNYFSLFVNSFPRVLRWSPFFHSARDKASSPFLARVTGYEDKGKKG